MNTNEENMNEKEPNLFDNSSAVDAEIVETNVNAVTLVDSGDRFAISTKCTDIETLFLNKDNFLPLIKQVKAIARGLVADEHTKDGVKARKAMNAKLAKLKTLIEDEGKKVAAELKAKPKLVDATRKAVKDTIEMLQDEIMAPVKAIQQRADEIVEISNMPALAIGCDSLGCQQVLDELEKLVRDEAYWQESYKDAVGTITEAKRQVAAMKAGAEKAEAEKLELEKLRERQAEFERAEREKAEAAKREAEETARKAQAEAERVKREAEEAKRKAEQELAEANRRAAEAEAMAHVDCGEGDAEKTRSEMLFPDDEREYKRTCNRETLDDLKALGASEELARKLITEIVHGKVRHLRMMY